MDEETNQQPYAWNLLAFIMGFDVKFLFQSVSSGLETFFWQIETVLYIHWGRSLMSTADSGKVYAEEAVFQ